MASGQGRKGRGKCWGDSVTRERRREKAAPLDQGRGQMGESPEFLTKGQFQRETEGYNLCFGQGWERKGGTGQWLEGGVT